MKTSSSKCVSNHDSNGSAKKVVKKRSPIRRRRRIVDDRPVDFSGKKYFMVVQRTIPRNGRIQNGADNASANGSVRPPIECKVCRKNNDYVETLESRVESVENASNTLTAMCMDSDKNVGKSAIFNDEVAMIFQNMVSFHR